MSRSTCSLRAYIKSAELLAWVVRQHPSNAKPRSTVKAEVPRKDTADLRSGDHELYSRSTTLYADASFRKGPHPRGQALQRFWAVTDAPSGNRPPPGTGCQQTTSAEVTAASKQSAQLSAVRISAPVHGVVAPCRLSTKRSCHSGGISRPDEAARGITYPRGIATSTNDAKKSDQISLGSEWPERKRFCFGWHHVMVDHICT
mmetsp:Transcript_35758/g.93518  ORF Transcript_35758/g.93518 Transcript_35758/m.93518 type:complete len:202 (-) Transcript_35758:2070-2675(-)